jgi:hypothetical protein
LRKLFDSIRLGLLLAGVIAALAACNPATLSNGGGNMKVYPGPASSNWSGTYDFGEMGIGLQGSAATFTIANVGYATLSLDSDAISFSGANAADFSLVSKPDASLPIGSSTSFALAFSPSTVGAENATVSIVSNLGSQTFAVAGTGTYSGAMAASYTSDGITWNALSPGGVVPFPTVTAASGPQTVGLRISNLSPTARLALVGPSPVSITAATGLYSLVTLPVSPIQPTNSTDFVISESYAGPGAYTDTVTVASSDSSFPSFAFVVSGTQS